VAGSCYHGMDWTKLADGRIQWLAHVTRVWTRRIWLQLYPEADMNWIHLAVDRIPVAESYRYRIDMTSRVKISYFYYVNICSFAYSFPRF